MKHIPRKDVAWVIIQKQNRFLLAQRSLEDKEGGTWTFPGGKKDSKDNDLTETARRELYEEVGLVGDQFQKLFQTYLEKYCIQIFICHRFSGKPKPMCDDIIGIGWFTLQEMYLLGENLAPHVNNILPKFAYFIGEIKHINQVKIQFPKNREKLIHEAINMDY